MFRTNATNGNYVGAGKWIALIAPNANPDTRTDDDYWASNALYTFAGELASPPGAAQIQNPYGPPPASDVVPLETPEGYAVLSALNGSSYDIFIDLPGSTYAKYVKNGSPPSGYSTSNRNDSAFLANKQETYDGRAALNLDTDFDGINNTMETSCGLNNTNPDTDGDGIGDGREYRKCWDTDGDTYPDANDTDSDGDGIPDALEDTNLNGRWDAGETDAMRSDTDLDGIADGTEDADHDGVRDASETSPTDKDTDDDGIADKAEIDGSWCYVWEASASCSPTAGRVTDPLAADSDGDGLQDGQEIGRTSAGVDTLVSAFKADSDPSSTTNPKVADTDADGLSDRLEDANLNGRVDSGEPNPALWDTDGDKLPDGWVNVSTTPGVDGWTGEDKNLNGSRDQDADGNYTETDFLANDSDVDGILDGAETNGTWSYANGVAGCGEDKNPCKLNPRNPDFDGDGLRDGQETAGWMVGIWRESTMEKVTNYTVNSDPTDATSDGDALTDFEEFMNGSDPRALDTDKDGINDTAEIERKSNVTGVEGSPPRIENVSLNVGITWEWWGLLYLPTKAKVTASFDVSDNVGIAYIDVRFTRYTGSETRKVAFSTNPANYTLSYRVEQVFEFSILEALVAGADVNITAYDVNGNGAWGEFHVKSVVEAVVEAIAALFSAIAKVIVEAASAAFNWITDFVEALLVPLFAPVFDFVRAVAVRASMSLKSSLPEGISRSQFANTSDPYYATGKLIDDILSPIVVAAQFILTSIVAIQLLLTFLRNSPATPAALATELLVSVIIGVVLGVALDLIVLPMLANWLGGEFNNLLHWLFPGACCNATGSDGAAVLSWLVDLLIGAMLWMYVKKGPMAGFIAMGEIVLTNKNAKQTRKLDLLNTWQLLVGLALVVASTTINTVDNTSTGALLAYGLAWVGFAISLAGGAVVLAVDDVLDTNKPFVALSWLEEVIAVIAISAGFMAIVARSFMLAGYRG